MLFYRQCPAGSVPYTIRAGDTLHKIAAGYGISVKDIFSLNAGIDPRLLSVGQQICLPGRVQKYPMCPTSNYYVVVKGDTLESIAKHFNVNPQQLLYSNYGINPYELYIDQILCIPIAPSPVFISVNVADRKLIVYKDGGVFRTFDIAIENPALPIPVGAFTVLNKQLDTGEDYGARWIGLSEAGYGIHGTNTPSFIKAVASGNCIIMSDKDVSELFNLVPIGTTVSIM